LAAQFNTTHCKCCPVLLWVGVTISAWSLHKLNFLLSAAVEIIGMSLATDVGSSFDDPISKFKSEVRFSYGQSLEVVDFMVHNELL